MSGATSSWAREPLFWFTVLGVALFSVDGVLQGGVAAGSDDDAERVVRVGDATLRELRVHYEATSGVAPDVAALEPLIDRHVRDAVLAREARALGLDRGDLVIERRLVQKMELLIDASVAVPSPSDAAVAAWIADHASELEVPGRVALEHVFFDASRRVDPSGDAARALAGGDDDGDAFVLGRVLPETALPQIEERLGPQVAALAASASLGTWAGPVQGRFGTHLIRVTARSEARSPTVEEAAPGARRALDEIARAGAVRRAVDALIARYHVRVGGE